MPTVYRLLVKLYAKNSACQARIDVIHELFTISLPLPPFYTQARFNQIEGSLGISVVDTRI
jgi:hypothetical protein